ncbi:LOW QUALITY PROTEIN: hypothetical protein ColTof4_14428 [Colletotrichum tofieldiae]|nr:LOW QUALITY PROTEIN: hypothetical protein ColTof3_14852 [Colletotrichum tofieldiae]GKT82005.1 LOW QUALITY PROTEIN: hypothetical protein ColTof4_14428 [Colletotrichum tofieldiae]
MKSSNFNAYCHPKTVETFNNRAEDDLEDAVRRKYVPSAMLPGDGVYHVAKIAFSPTAEMTIKLPKRFAGAGLVIDLVHRGV